MSKAVLVIGEAGGGKSTSIRTLPPKETFLINSLGKDLPFKGSAKMYTYWDKNNNPNGNMVKTTSSMVVLQWMDFVSQKMLHIKHLIIDDNTHQSSMEFLRRIKENNWDKFNDIAANMVAIAQKAISLRDDLTVYIMHHITETGDGVVEERKIKAMTIGKLVDQKLSSYESLFTVVLLAKKQKNENNKLEYFFLTQDADSTAKSPMGMFEDEKIPNDLALVNKSIRSFYEDELIEETQTK